MTTNKIIDYMNELYPNVGCELFYTKPYELVIAVMLSAQTTDKSVNQVTAVLFSKYYSLESLANAELKDVEKIIRNLGLYKNKAPRVIGIAQKLISDFNGEVPQNKEQLMTLPGVGNKTAGVILAEIFKIPEFPVDTHVSRISKRLKLASEKDTPIEVEKKLKKTFEKQDWIRLHHQFIHFGRYFCFARNPQCKNCKICDICKENTAKTK